MGDIIGGVDERAVGVRISIKLQTIHPNPGPGRDKTEEGKARRRASRKETRKEKGRERRRRKNLPNINDNRTNNKRKGKLVAEKARVEGWDAILLSEVRAEVRGVAWLGRAKI